VVTGVFDDTLTPLQNDFLTDDEKKLVERLRKAAANPDYGIACSAKEILGLIAIIDRMENPSG
jgi:hypothetical protein